MIEEIEEINSKTRPEITTKKEHIFLKSGIGALVLNYLLLVAMTREPNPINISAAMERMYRTRAEKQLYISYNLGTGLADTNKNGQIEFEERMICYQRMGFDRKEILKKGFPTPTINQLNQAIASYETLQKR